MKVYTKKSGAASVRAGKVLAVVLAAATLLGGCGGGNSSPGSGSTQGQGMQGVTGSSAASQSTNWSGYALTGSPLGFSQISGTWTVPAANCSGSSSTSTESAAWAGIGGLVTTDQTLIQAGTEQDCNGGSASYYAWWEGFPAPSEDISTGTEFPVHAGDQVTVTIASNLLVLWNITIHDVTAGWTFTTTTPFVAVGDCAEWIQEAPTNIGTGGTQLATLTNYGRISFSALTADSAGPALTDADSIQMVNASNAVISNPSAPNAAGNGFDVCFGAGGCN